MADPIKFTKPVVEAVSYVTKNEGRAQRLYFDAELKGFGLCVGAKTKTFFVQRDVNGKSVRTTIGRFGVYTVAQARDAARDLIRDMGKGINPNREKAQARIAGITFGEALTMHLGSNKKRSDRTQGNYRYLVDQYLADWLSKPLAEITRQDCRERHAKIARDCKSRAGDARKDRSGGYVANSAFRVFRAAYNTALKVNDELGVNPAIAIDWFPEERRKAAIPSKSLAAWHREVLALKNPVRRDYLLFVLFTGLRRENAASVQWAHVDFENRALLIPKPKGSEPFMVPLSRQLLAILKHRLRCKTTKAFFSKSPWVFPAESESGHIAEPKEALSVKFTTHGLRNTFITVAESEDLSPYAIKMLVNHSLPDKQDVTAGYISAEVERLRKPMQQVADRLTVLCGGKPKAGVAA